jgi:hypothetical protein
MSWRGRAHLLESLRPLSHAFNVFATLGNLVRNGSLMCKAPRRSRLKDWTYRVRHSINERASFTFDGVKNNSSFAWIFSQEFGFPVLICLESSMLPCIAVPFDEERAIYGPLHVLVGLR